MSRIKDLINKKLPASKGKLGKEEPQTLQSLKLKLSRNSLAELKLGFDEVHFHSKRDVQSLITVVKEQFLHRLSIDKHSCLKSIRIGWKLPSFAVGPVLEQLVPLLLQDPVRVTHLQLNLPNVPIPEDCLRRIVSCPTLECLDLRSVKVRVPTGIATSTSTRSDGCLPHLSPSLLRRHDQHDHHQQQQQQHHSESHVAKVNHANAIATSADDHPAYREENVIHVAACFSLNTKTLKLIDCDLNGQHISVLCAIIRRKMHALQHLSLRHNRDLDGGYKNLFDLRYLKSLDLSLCDLGPDDGYCLGRAVSQLDAANCSNGLEKLSLAGNYRLSATIPDLISSAATRLRELDCSFCDVQGERQAQVFRILASTSDCSLRSFAMQGTRLNDVADLTKLIRTNTSLRRLVLNHPREPVYVDLHGMEQIRSAFKLNYTIQVLKLDVRRRGQIKEILDDMEFWLELNRCGRRAILQDNNIGSKGWATILAQAAANDDVNVLFWLLRHGAPVMYS